MTQPLNTDGQLGQALTALFPGERPSPELAARVAALAARQEEKTRMARSRQFRWRLAAAVGVALLAAAAFQLTRPMLAAAAILARMDGAMQGARSAHCVLSTLTNGAWVKTNETWYQNGQWRMERDGVGYDTQVYTHGRLWDYEPQAKTVTVVSQPGPFAFNSNGFSVSAMLGSGAFGTPAPQVQRLGDAPYAGRRAVEIAVVTPMRERLIFWADPATDLPFHFEAQRMTPQGWTTGMEGDLTYNQPLPKSLFVPDFPRTATVFDKDAGVQALHEKWARGIARQQAGKYLITLRDVEVNPRGDVFLLYTAGHGPEDFQRDVGVSVEDDANDRYTYGRQFEPASHEPNPTFLFNGERLEGLCLATDSPSRAVHSLKITFQTQSVPPPGPGTYRIYHLGGPATFTLPITRRIKRNLPGYMPFMEMPIDEQQLDELHGRG